MPTPYVTGATAMTNVAPMSNSRHRTHLRACSHRRSRIKLRFLRWGMMKQPRLRALRIARAARRVERQTAPPPPAPCLPAIAAKADDLEEIKKLVEDAAAVSGGLWLSYLFVLSYIAIAAGAVTHEDLLLVRPVKLPLLNVELPLNPSAPDPESSRRKKCGGCLTIPCGSGRVPCGSER
jgi:hypothetical protein